MLYPKDFHRTRKSSLSRYPWRNNGKQNIKNSVAVKEQNHAISFLKNYMAQSSLHGVRYVVDNDLKLFEKLIWAIIVILSIISTARISIELANRFYRSPLQTVVESTIYPVNEITFPAITICNYNRIDWTKLKSAKEKFIPNTTKEIEELFEIFVSKMEVFEFGNFDNFEALANVSLESLDHISVAELSDFMTHSCEAMFINYCWWRYKAFPCCNLFVKQRTEYGYCYAFNSAVNEIGLKRSSLDSDRKTDWPMKTSGFGDWTGLRMNVMASAKTKMPESRRPTGILVIVHHPFAWPNNGIFAPVGSTAGVVLKPKLSYALPNTRRYNPVSRECLFNGKIALQKNYNMLMWRNHGRVVLFTNYRQQDETKKSKYFNLPGLNYHIDNCLSGCRQKYVVQSCNCTVEPLFPIGDYRACKASDFHCLYEYNDLFNFEVIVREENDENSKNQSIMTCPCLHECFSLDYQAELLPMHLAKENLTDEMIILDVHYQYGTLIKYRTEVVYEWLDLLVAFGGIAGLFMGASMLSGVELLYYFTIGLWVFVQDRVKQTAKKPSRDSFTNKKFPFKDQSIRIWIQPSKH